MMEEVKKKYTYVNSYCFSNRFQTQRIMLTENTMHQSQYYDPERAAKINIRTSDGVEKNLNDT